jgi:cob(I)alamin adenosyltransferase
MKNNLVVVERWLCNNITEAAAEVEACKDFVAHCRNNVPVDRKQLSLAKAALRSAERELRDWQKGIVPPLAEPQLALGAAVGA